MASPSVEEQLADVQAQLESMKMRMSATPVYTGEPWEWNDVTDQTLTLSSPWNAHIFEGAEPPKESYESFCVLLSTLARRVNHCENQRRVDRERIEELEREQSFYTQHRRALEGKIAEMQKFMAIPEIVGGKVENVRPMTTTEAERLRAGLTSLKDGDRKLEVVRNIMGQPASEEGCVEVDIEKATMDQRWLMYYLISNYKINKRVAPKGCKGRVSAGKLAKSPTVRSLSVASVTNTSSFAGSPLARETPCNATSSAAALPYGWLDEDDDDEDDEDDKPPVGIGGF